MAQQEVYDGSDSEDQPLLQTSQQREEQDTLYHTLKRNRCCLLVFLIGVVSLISAIIISYFLYFKYVIGLKVLALNVWGMPAKVGSEDKELRIAAVGDMINKAEFDVYLLAELWMRPDHETIRQRLPPGYFMSEVGDFALSTCDGRALPTFCSGLAIVSKYPFIEKQFLEYSYHGDILKPDGEYWARKGAGRARISPHPSFVVDVFVTHTCAIGPDYSNAYYREHQVQELVSWVNNSDADFVILGGDFNTDPSDKETSYHNLKNAMFSSMEEFFHDIKEWLLPERRHRATYGNPRNNYSNMYEPVIYDYIWHKAKGWNMIWTNLFEVPWLTCLKHIVDEVIEEVSDANVMVSKEVNKKVSLSDHEAVTSHLLLWKSLLT